MLVGVNVADSLLVEAVVVLCCKIGQIMFVYFSLPIDGNPRRLSFWQSLLDHIRQKLSKWKLAITGLHGKRFSLVESIEDGLWYKGMTAKYEEDGDNFRRWGRMSSIWWKDLYDIIYGGGGGVASWFLDGVWRKGRNNENSSFCCDLRFNGGGRWAWLEVENGTFCLGRGVVGGVWRTINKRIPTKENLLR
ncbi:transmembrane protein, putative [Medicago truncatula]|uniref:Transmembrane protein, putative n=1 Tax=Medicago truncatula TaxID=3880 RepID=G7IN40_MEDTR|nr:transmembrane protein, putative [Medicago truncatula]